MPEALITKRSMRTVEETTLEIDLKALAHNYKYLRDRLAPTTQFLASAKASAYGSDVVTVARKLESLGVDYFGVAYTKEGVLLREAGITTPILVLYPLPSYAETLIDYQLEPNLYSPKMLHAFLGAVQRKGQKAYPIHIKFNTGFNRFGFGEEEVEYLATQLKGHQGLKVVSVFSHLAASEDAEERLFTETQIDLFQKISEQLTQKLGYAPLRHILNTSGILNYPEAQFDMVRSGIGLYGYGNDSRFDAALKPVVTLKTLISQLRHIAPGASVGYNRLYKAEGPRTIATLPLGYADGIGRQYGRGKAYVLVHGKKAPIVGNVCMDVLMVDVTGIDCQEGDEVIVFGPGNSAAAFAAAAQATAYEILTAISQRVKRTILED